MEKSGWTDKVTNEEVLSRVGVQRQLMNIFLKRNKSWKGHVLRGNGLLKDVVDGRMAGKRARGSGILCG